MSRPGTGKWLVGQQGVRRMGRFLPVHITLEVKKTRTGWLIIVRVNLIF
jgi:hypothetical protein